MTQDMPNSVTDAQRELHKMMRRDTDLRWLAEPPPEYKQPLPLWRIVAAFALSAALLLVALSAVAAQPERTWVIWDTTANQQFHPHQFSSATACNVDIGGLKDGSGKKLACVKLKGE